MHSHTHSHTTHYTLTHTHSLTHTHTHTHRHTLHTLTHTHTHSHTHTLTHRHTLHTPRKLSHTCYCLTALVNKGNCLYAQSRFEKACDFYQEAQRVEATCTEALYNLGLAYKRLGQLALECFNKLQTIFKNLPEVIYQLADVYPLKFSNF